MCESSAVCACAIPQIHTPIMQRTLSDDRCVVSLVCYRDWVCVYKLQHIMGRCGKMEEQREDISASFIYKKKEKKVCFSHAIQASIWLPHCWQPSCVLTIESLWDLNCFVFLLGNQRCTQFSQAKLVWFNVMSCTRLLASSRESYWSHYLIWYFVGCLSDEPRSKIMPIPEES